MTRFSMRDESILFNRYRYFNKSELGEEAFQILIIFLSRFEEIFTIPLVVNDSLSI